MSFAGLGSSLRRMMELVKARRWMGVRGLRRERAKTDRRRSIVGGCKSDGDGEVRIVHERAKPP